MTHEDSVDVVAFSPDGKIVLRKRGQHGRSGTPLPARPSDSP